MAIGDLENPIRGELASKIGNYASAWWAMRNTAQMMHNRSQLPKSGSLVFMQRGLLDGAVVTYWRCFGSGRRRVDLTALVDQLDVDQLAVHEAVHWWRDKHVAHGVDPDLEAITTHLLWGNFGVSAPTVRIRLTTQLMPDVPDFEQRFEDLAQFLSVRIWDVYLYPLQQRWLEQMGPARLMQMKQSAVPFPDPVLPSTAILVAANVGSQAPSAPTVVRPIAPQ